MAVPDQSPKRVSTRGASPLDTLSHIDWWKLLCTLLALVARPLIELAYAIRKRSLPWTVCLAIGAVTGLIVATRLDLFLARKLNLAAIYPYRPTLYWIYCAAALTSGFWGWALRETWLRSRLIKRLTTVFQDAGLKSPLGSLPKFIADRPVDAFTRKMSLYRSGLAKAQFEKAKPALESALQVYIDEIRESREVGTVDLFYAMCPMPTFIEMGDVRAVPPLQFVVGQTRARRILVTFRDVPHLMVAGQTGGGKSTFLRLLITLLYVNAPDIEFTLIDLKGGMEFQTFENLRRARVVPDVKEAINALVDAECALKSRMELLKKHGCKDLDAFLALQAREAKQTKVASADEVQSVQAEGVAQESLGASSSAQGVSQIKLQRMVIVVDEAAEMFLAGHHAKVADIQRAREILSTIARQGRSVGVHLIVATQRPDSRALDPQVKANLTGVLCFQMQNDASSITVLGNGRATEIPPIPGRAIWKCGNEMVEVQVPYLSTEDASKLLESDRIPSKSQNEAGATAAGSSPNQTETEPNSSNPVKGPPANLPPNDDEGAPTS